MKTQCELPHQQEATRGAIALPATPETAPLASNRGASRLIVFPARPAGWHHWLVKRKRFDDEPFTVIDFDETGLTFIDTTVLVGTRYY